MNSAQHLMDQATKALFVAVDALGGEVLLVEGKNKEGVTNSVVAVVYNNPVMAEKLKVFMEGLAAADEDLQEKVTFKTGTTAGRD